MCYRAPMADHDFSEEIRPLGPIPREMYSEYEERPFKTCTRCGETLVDFRDGYRVSKVYRGGEVLFEYALCAPCFLSILDESSDETKEALHEYQKDRIRDTMGSEECVLCGKQQDETPNGEYALVAACLGEQLLDMNMVCGECVEIMNTLVSKKTRDVWDRFVQENFPGVPADLEPFPNQPAPAFF